MVTVDPLPSEDELFHFYQQYAGNTGYLKKKESKLKRAGKRIKRIMKHTGGRRFLDIGCNVGYAVEAARLLGFEAVGIDLDSESVGFAQKMFPENRFTACSAEALAENNEQFDVIYCAEVIEHVRELKPFAASLAALLRPAGVLYLTTPDASHFRVPKSFPEWPEVKPPEHIQYFSKQAMKMLLESNGFAQVRFQLNFKTGMRVTAGLPRLTVKEH